MAEAAQAAVSGPGQVLHVVADAGYSNGEQAEACEAIRAVATAVLTSSGIRVPNRQRRFPVVSRLSMSVYSLAAVATAVWMFSDGRVARPAAWGRNAGVGRRSVGPN